jgi:hypothetical protein
MAAGEVGDVLEPVLPAAAETVDEEQWRPVADLDVVDLGQRRVRLAPRMGFQPGGVDLDPSQVLSPVDPQPLRVGIAVGVGTVGLDGLRAPLPGSRPDPEGLFFGAVRYA